MRRARQGARPSRTVEYGEGVPTGRYLRQRSRRGPPSAKRFAPGGKGPVPGRVSSRDKGDPRRGGQAQERARRRTCGAPHKQATSTADAARGSLVAAEKAAAPSRDRRLRLVLHRQSFVGLPAPGSACHEHACAALGRPSRSDGAFLRLGCRPFRGRAPCSGARMPSYLRDGALAEGDLPQQVQLVQGLPGSQHDAGQGIFGDRHG